MQIRKSEFEDLDTILEIYEYARKQMKENGNPTQWGDNRPSEETIEKDIQNGVSYCVEEDTNLVGVFAFIIGEEPTYSKIEGAWLNNETYGTIHRVASNGKKKGILQECLRFCENKISNIRIDTHHDNKIMQHLLEKNNYQKCGTIYVEDGTPRIAYQKNVK